MSHIKHYEISFPYSEKEMMIKFNERGNFIPAPNFVKDAYNFLRTNIKSQDLFLEFLNNIYTKTFNIDSFKLNYYHECRDIFYFIKIVRSKYRFGGKSMTIQTVNRQSGVLIFKLVNKDIVVASNDNILSDEVREVMDLIDTMLSMSVKDYIVNLFIDLSLGFIHNTFIYQAFYPLTDDIKNKNIEQICANLE